MNAKRVWSWGSADREHSMKRGRRTEGSVGKEDVSRSASLVPGCVAGKGAWKDTKVNQWREAEEKIPGRSFMREI